MEADATCWEWKRKRRYDGCDTNASVRVLRYEGAVPPPQGGCHDAGRLDRRRMKR